MAGKNIHRVEISGDAGLRVAQDIAGTLRQALAGHDNLIIGTDAMTGVDITTVQLLLSARRQALADGKALSLAAPASGALHQFLTQIGCLDAAGRPLTPDGDFWLNSTAMHGGKAA
jgi:multidrug resistance efflux pump